MERSPPRVQIVVVSWNGGAELRECLASLRRVPTPGVRLLLVDNGSRDGSPAAARRAAPGLDVIENAENRGFAAAANQGLRWARESGADFALLLNPDTVVAPDFLDALLAAARDPQGAGLWGPKILLRDEPAHLWSAGGALSWWRGQVWHRGLRELDRGAWDTPARCDWLTGCALLISRACLEAVGGLDEAFVLYGEDVDLCVRARAAGFACQFVPAARVWHRVSASSGGGATPLKAYHRVRSQLLLCRKHARWWHWLAIPPSAVASFAAEAGRAVRRGPGAGLVIRALVRGAWDSLRGRPRPLP
ncbi:MAG: glycosyltransferase family 2 protein [Myxococcota bacterium]|nr:glycosyltransferase family 2 protein [Myxococcota bacterium]